MRARNGCAFASGRAPPECAPPVRAVQLAPESVVSARSAVLFRGGSTMQSFRTFMIAVMACFVVPVLAGAAHAGDGLAAGTSAGQCVRGCSAQKKACIQAARTVSLACKRDCRENSAPTELGACMRGCSTTFRDSKDTCRADQKTCIAGCRAASDGGASSAEVACNGSCGMDLADCARGVVTAAKTCLTGCRTAPDRLACLQGCAATAMTGAQTCASNFESCGTGCSP